LAGKDHDISWHVVNDEFFEYATGLIEEVDTQLYGRVTFEMMASYWPTPEAIEGDPVIGPYMNNTAKFVFSKTLDNADQWGNSRLVTGDVAEEVAKLKEQPGKNMVIYGSGSIVSALTDAGLMDEYWLFVVPVALGDGIPLFQNLAGPANLKLIESKTLQTGVVALKYIPQVDS